MFIGERCISNHRVVWESSIIIAHVSWDASLAKDRGFTSQDHGLAADLKTGVKDGNPAQSASSTQVQISTIK